MKTPLPYLELKESIFILKKKNKDLKSTVNTHFKNDEKRLDRPTQAANKTEKYLKNLNEAEQLVNYGTWEFDATKNAIWWSDQMYRIFDFSPQEIEVTYESWMANIFQEDRESVDLACQKLISSKAPLNIEYRVFTKLGNLKFVKVKCNVHFDKDGNLFKLYGVVIDITAAKEYELLLEKSSSTKSKLMSILAHDLRAPFNKIIGFSGILVDNIKEASLSIAESEKYLNILHKSSQQTLDLVDNLLNWVRFQSTEITFKPTLFPVSEVIKEVLGLEILFAGAKKITLNYTAPEKLDVYADKNMLKIVIRNLVSNAIKFTNYGGKISIDSFLRKGELVIKVKDNGVGIEPQRAKNIFTNSTNATTFGTQNEEGTGKGLVICKELIDRHQGRIYVKR
ncbi:MULTISPECIES: PAS domain-containing sensor histidine kinase [unclassified Polaribacter]|uniref:PAS domain-containing sensor histidine kinase n=1 Tax=unclassified Polaribacter TaxID=196858 RepID=UPI0011BF1BDB|nr:MULTISPECIES: PAS domain-containing sensor histidine kinase [unclassified Polaribacter]TXD48169.1 PAS domain S-box protein [Polaribacter sp. IC063]TXD55687.1 PAS domain S-box protein [Polaribacter sp. IC066]